MIIDFHTHAFPDKIASKALDSLKKAAKTEAFHDGTISDLSIKTKEALIDYSIVLPVVTSPSQTKSINDFAINVNNSKEYYNILSFGGIHPDYEFYEEELIRLKENGIKGIKLHPEYQKTYIDDNKYIKIIDKAFELGLIVIIHAGIDIGIESDIKASPKRILNCYNKLKNKGIFVLAHMGSWKMWDEVYNDILGKDFYIDTAFSLKEVIQNDKKIKLLQKEEIIKFIKKHSSKKILFATDAPWSNQKEYVEFMNSLNLNEEDYKNIMGLNAKKILNI